MGWTADDVAALLARRRGEKIAKETASREAIVTIVKDDFLLLLKAHGVPVPHTEFLFAPPRKWRADYCWPDAKLIIEREGGLFAKGRAGMAHAMPSAIKRDMERSNAAQLLGYLYLRYLPAQLDSGEVIDTVRRLVIERWAK